VVGGVVVGRPLLLEVGGTKSTCKKSQLPTTAKIFDAKQFPNPHQALLRGELELSAQSIFEWMEANGKKTQQRMEDMVSSAVEELRSGRSVRVECFGGAHRSQAVAWKVLQSLQFLCPSAAEKVSVVVLDADPLSELPCRREM